MQLPTLDTLKIGVIGLGYVGLPLATYLARHFEVIGFDIDPSRIGELEDGIDRTREVTDEELRLAKHLTFSANAQDLEPCNFYIATVPTPIDKAKRPDLSALQKASAMIGQVISAGDIVVYESTVYPGATEDDCIPIIEKESGLRYNKDFFAGYSPERINPGDHEHRLPDILKITSGSTPQVADLVNSVYARIITAGTHKASSIKVAEAAKVIENIQRDLNIALINELTLLFKKMDLDAREVLEAAGTKWNFHRYQPGLVGGHCIGVDPYYLTYKAQMIGFHPEIIMAGRRTNDAMAVHVTHDIITTLLAKQDNVGAAKLLVMGFTFKENCPDIRNTKIVDLVAELNKFVAEIVIYDPHANPEEVREEYGLELTNELPAGPFDGVVLAVAHKEFTMLGTDDIKALIKPDKGFVYDMKGVLPRGAADARLY